MLPDASRLISVFRTAGLSVSQTLSMIVIVIILWMQAVNLFSPAQSMCTHLSMPLAGTVTSDDYFAGTRAAACGGTTTVFDFALQDFNEKMTDTVKRRDIMCAPNAAVDYSFHVAVKDVSNGLIDGIGECVEMGIPSFKVFMVYDFGVRC